MVVTHASDHAAALSASLRTGQRQQPPKAARSPLRLALLATVAAAAVAALTALGVWQLERRIWKLDLIARIDQRIHAPVVSAPAPAAWSTINAADDAYRHVDARGHFLHDKEILVQAVTEFGRGFWVMTPLVTDAGLTMLVNRGFVPPDRRDPVTRMGGQIAGETTVTGLLRMTEPKGALLRPNDPASGRWTSRDVAAIAAARGLRNVAPYFIDADAAPAPADAPRGGLTVIAFPNNHLVYALTWFALAVLLTGATVLFVRDEWRAMTKRSPDQPSELRG
jgi:surfeit locus 1 family protein